GVTNNVSGASSCSRTRLGNARRFLSSSVRGCVPVSSMGQSAPGHAAGGSGESSLLFAATPALVCDHRHLGSSFGPGSHLCPLSPTIHHNYTRLSPGIKTE